MLDMFLGIYITVAFFIAGIFAIVTYLCGGFAGYAEVANRLLTKGEKPFTSNEVQWKLVIMTLAWPVLALIFAYLAGTRLLTRS